MSHGSWNKKTCGPLTVKPVRMASERRRVDSSIMTVGRQSKANERRESQAVGRHRPTDARQTFSFLLVEKTNGPLHPVKPLDGRATGSAHAKGVCERAYGWQKPRAAALWMRLGGWGMGHGGGPFIAQQRERGHRTPAAGRTECLGSLLRLESACSCTNANVVQSIVCRGSAPAGGAHGAQHNDWASQAQNTTRNPLHQSTCRNSEQRERATSSLEYEQRAQR